MSVARPHPDRHAVIWPGPRRRTGEAQTLDFEPPRVARIFSFAELQTTGFRLGSAFRIFYITVLSLSGTTGLQRNCSEPATVTVQGPVDSDHDGVPDDQDACPGTVAGQIVNSHGCSIAQLAPRDCPMDLRTTEVATAVEVCRPSMTNEVYVVQYAPAVDTNRWTDLGVPVSGNGMTNCWFDSTRGVLKIP